MLQSVRKFLRKRLFFKTVFYNGLTWLQISYFNEYKRKLFNRYTNFMNLSGHMKILMPYFQSLQK